MELNELHATRRKRLLWLRTHECKDKNVILADKIGKSDSYVSRMFLDLDNKYAKKIGETVARHIEQVFNKPKYWLDGLIGDIDNEDLPETNSSLSEVNSEHTVKIEIEKGVKITGEAVLAADGSISEINEISGYLPLLYPGASFALKIKGNALWPRINSGELIIVNPNQTISPGDDVLIHAKDGSYAIKVYNFSRNNECYLSSVNSTERPIALSESDVISMQFISAIVKPSVK